MFTTYFIRYNILLYVNSQIHSIRKFPRPRHPGKYIYNYALTVINKTIL